MTTLSYRDAVAKALQDSMRDEARLILIGQNLSSHAFKNLAEKHGAERVRDSSISESAMVGMAVGAAMKFAHRSFSRPRPGRQRSRSVVVL